MAEDDQSIAAHHQRIVHQIFDRLAQLFRHLSLVVAEDLLAEPLAARDRAFRKVRAQRTVAKRVEHLIALGRAQTARVQRG
eukprot:CAMPEP_0119099156 /NCGR_PEP_ID=MMETSP1178-20130426/184948_1 /TAXON_ID=33656 /ORGANISM="unid sp, Strain CCMP2000" /LENGTH=80 /DNA_ID=CAMNT_0007083135 /DNA_START=399 /DNA_END=641 /DNA_ORIENTATION=+